MKISQLIEKLRRIQAESGDLPVVTWGDEAIDGYVIAEVVLLDHDIPDWNLQANKAVCLVIAK